MWQPCRGEKEEGPVESGDVGHAMARGRGPSAKSIDGSISDGENDPEAECNSFPFRQTAQSIARSTHVCSSEKTRGERGGREVAKARKGRKIRHFAPHNMHMPANMNPRDCSPSGGKNVDIRYFTSSSSSLWTFVPAAASVSSSSPPGPQRRHRRRRHRIARSTVGSPTARRHRGGRAARGGETGGRGADAR